MYTERLTHSYGLIHSSSHTHTHTHTHTHIYIYIYIYIYSIYVKENIFNSVNTGIIYFDLQLLLETILMETVTYVTMKYVTGFYLKKSQKHL